MTRMANTFAPTAIRTALGADLGGTKVAVGAVDEKQRVLDRWNEPTCDLDTATLLDLVESMLRTALERHPTAAAIGLGLPCAIDNDRGVALNAVNLPLVDVPIRDLLAERLGVPVLLDNDANLAALAEHRFGAACGTRDAVVLTVGTGVGGGVVMDGEVFRASGTAPEIGHIVIDADGPPCQGTCPNNGCVEALASGTALGREGRAAAETNPNSALGKALAEGMDIDGRVVTKAALGGDSVAEDVVALIGKRLGVAVASLANIFAPDIFVVGGGVAAAGELLFAPIRSELHRRALPPQNMTPVVGAWLGPDAGMIGAAAMALEAPRR